jgi:hypothetical protein
MTERFNANQEEVGISSSGGPAGSGLDLTALGVGVGSGQTASFQENNSSLNFEFTLRWEDVAQNLGRLQEKKYLGEFVDDMEMRDKMVEDYLSSNLVNGIVAGAGVSINRASGIVTVTSNTAKTYKVGDTGPGGGIIFFVDRFDEYSGFTYLEVAPASTQVSRTWATGANQGASVAGADSTALGAGLDNTTDIAAQAGNVAATCAAVYCDTLTSGGQSDWYLPSIAELKILYDVAFLSLGGAGFVRDYYWSSTENAAGNAVSKDFYTGSEFLSNKSDTVYVRPIRQF